MLGDRLDRNLRDGSSRQTLAPAGATRGDDLAAADRRHSRTVAMTALAHDPAGLICPFHRFSPPAEATERFRFRPFRRCERMVATISRSAIGRDHAEYVDLAVEPPARPGVLPPRTPTGA